MNASKFTNGSEAEVLDKTSQTPPKSAQRNAARAAAKKVSKKASGQKAKTKRRRVNAVETPLRRNFCVAIAGATTWLPASSSVGIAVVANASASAMDRRHGLTRRRSR